MKPLFCALSVVCFAACGAIGPPKPDGGSGGGDGGGGGSNVLGGGSATGGGAGTGGGGSTTGGGAGTGGGSTTGGGGGVAPLVWSTVGMQDVTSSFGVVGLSGDANELYAGQELGDFFRSTGGGFVKLFKFSSGIRGLYAAGGTVVVVMAREIRTCTSSCTTDAAFATLSLNNSAMGWSLWGETACGEGPNHIVVIVSDGSSASPGQVMEWNGTAWSRTNSNLGINNPTACWFDGGGNMYVSGDDKIVFVENGSSTPITFSANNTSYRGGATIDGVTWVVGPNQFVAKGTGLSIAQVSTGHTASQVLSTVGGLSGDEVYLLGYYSQTNAIGSGLRWNGSGFVPMGNTLPNFVASSNVRVAHRTGANELFLAGSDSSGPLIIRGRR